MAYGINGTMLRLQDPYDKAASSLQKQRQYYYSYGAAHSVNSPIMHSVIWNGGLSEAEEPSPSNYASNDGDVVNVIFDVYQCNDSLNVGTWPDEWTLVSSIRKSRDIRNISQFDRVGGGDGVQVNQGHIFTVDISEVCKDLLTYSLLPHGKGTYMNPFFGGLNGGNQQPDNLAQPVWNNKFIQTRNGSVRWIRVYYRTEIIDGNGIIQEATLPGSRFSSSLPYRILNNAPDFDSQQTSSVNGYAAIFLQTSYPNWSTNPRQHQSLCMNYTYSTLGIHGKKVAKDVRMTETAEQLQWIQVSVNNIKIYSNPTATPNPENDGYNPNNTSDLVDDVYMYITAYDANMNVVRYAKLYDWTRNLRPKIASQGGGLGPDVSPALNCYPRNHNANCAQNISPVYINANCIHINSTVKDTWERGGTTYTRELIDNLGGAYDSTSLFLNDEISYYSISGGFVTSLSGNGDGTILSNAFEYRWYKIDRDRELATGAQNSGSYYRGVYYTELRTDYLTNLKKIRCKGIYYWAPQVPYVRIHWLNKAGGIDSYTFKGDATVSYNAQKDIILRPESSRFNWGIGRSSGANPYPSDNSDVSATYYGDTVRGADVYNGGLEVLNVDGNKSGTVSSLPLNKQKAEWLREIMLSPNVWTEINVAMPWTEGRMLAHVPYRTVTNIESGGNTSGQQPNNWDYVPLVITNASVDIYDDAKGLTTMTLEYTHSHAVVTQRN